MLNAENFCLNNENELRMMTNLFVATRLLGKEKHLEQDGSQIRLQFGLSRGELCYTIMPAGDVLEHWRKSGIFRRVCESSPRALKELQRRIK